MAKILIVDDSPVDRKIIGKVIRDGVEGIEILENSDGVNLVHQVREKGVQLVVLDLMLPGVSGLDLLKALKAHEDTRDVPVIVCSGLVEDEVIRDSLYLGAFDYFEKPLTDRAVRFMLAMKVRNALELVKRAVEVAFLREHDQITLMSTRTHFESVLEGYQIESNYPLTYLMMDIDGLKIFNDAYGRAAGDRLLKRVGKYFSREIDGLHLSARWGSDEFLLLLSNYDQHRCEWLAEDLRRYLRDEEDLHGINISIGLEIVENQLVNPDLPIQSAEEHLYSNKILASKSVRSKMLESIRQTLHEKNPREESHSARVSEIAGIIGKELGFSEFESKKVRMAGLMHDVGKISIDEQILNKPGKLQQDEWLEIKKHPEMGYRILSASTDTVDIAKAALTHHERYDGKGYPQGLVGEDIPLYGRLICVADSFDAMTGPRTYKEIYSLEKAVDEIKKNSGTQFDPEIVNAFLNAVDKGLIHL